MKMDVVDMQNLLKEKYDRLTVSIQSSLKRYYNLISLQNFIFYFDDIKKEDDRIWIFNTLSQYIDECIENVDFIDRNISRELYINYLNKVGNYYQNYLGFSLVPSLEIHAFFFCVLFLVLLIFMSWVFSIIIVIPIYIISLYILLRKRKAKKVFGVFY